MATGNELIDFSTFYSRLHLRGALHADTALRIGTGGGGGATEHDLPTLKDIQGRPYIPGSSFKGALRAHLEKLLRGMDETLACASTSRPEGAGMLSGCLTQADVARLKQVPRYRSDASALAREILSRSCWTCSLFGAPWLASKTLVRDLTVEPGTWFDHYQVRDGVAIDRDSETAAEGLKYDFEAVPPGTQFRFEMVVDNASNAELGLLLLGLREWEHGYVPIGGATSRGLGKVHLEVDWEHAEWLTAADLRRYFEGQPAAGLATEQDREHYWQVFLAALDGGRDEADA